MNLMEHRVPVEMFTDLATGGGGAVTIDWLARGQYSKHLLLVRGVLDATKQGRHPAEAAVRRAYDLLAAIQHEHPEAVDRVLRHPSVGAWARHTVRTLQAPGQLAGLAAAAAIHAGVSCEVDVPVLDGFLTLPSLGQVTVTGELATVHCSPEGAEVSAEGQIVRLDENVPGWYGLRPLAAEAAGVRLDVLVDDVDPYRAPGLANSRGRLSEAESRRWQELLDEGWDLLATHHTPVAVEVAAAIRVLTPLSAPPQGLSSATSRETFGCVALSTPPDGHALAVTLAHETAHNKLSALLDIVPLTKPEDGSLHYAPWRPDPRPIGGLLQGAYAYLGVTDFWRRQRHHEQGEQAMRAGAEFARWRAGARQVSQTILDSGRLTPPGEQFVGLMAERLDEWGAEPVEADSLELAKNAADRHRSLWRERNAGQ
ncbi:HEXXH motif domain-containing protein [Nonomuraea sp. NPDC050310]|uniref:HEXXH motif domain-containing protein n=1 Tax=unclassified Nonomuraea TaxID=2593643 RepID=UPI0034116E2E